MLADPRSQALVNNFAGQWLHIRNVAVFQPSPELLFHFDDNLRQAFERETQLFFESIIRENRSVLDLLDADYTFLNERLAKHYGIPGVYGERFRRVSLPADSPRARAAGAGLDSDGYLACESDFSGDPRQMDSGEYFRHAAAAAASERARAQGRTRPAKGAADARADGAHRANPVCAGCHAQMDQLGFALENFDAIGEWRDIYASGAPIRRVGEASRRHDVQRARRSSGRCC